MALRLALENEQTLPDGGPVFFHVTGKRSVDIGRDRHLDWTLPDPTRMISGKHCEVHYREGGYWLHDVSTNGTFLNGADQRMRGPHRLRNGDRFIVGHYIVGVSLDSSDEIGAAEASAIQSGSFDQQRAAYGEIWSGDREMAPPIDPQQLKIPREAARPVNAEFLDWAAAVPEPDVDRSRHSPFRPSKDNGDQSDMNWASGSLAMPKPVPPPSPVVPSPRPPVWTDDDASWGDGRAAARQKPPPTAPAATAPESGSIETVNFVAQLARAAGLPEEFFANRDASEVAEQLGAVLRINVESVMSLLQARTQAKQLTRSSSQTTIQAIENNPLKFSPTPEDAIRIMFGPPTQSYLDARGAFVQSFSDLKSHQLKTYMAMQHAVAKLISSIDPLAMARAMEAEGGSGSWLGSSKGKLWDAFLTHWKAHLGRDGNAPVDAFMAYFADYYDRGGKTGPE